MTLENSLALLAVIAAIVVAIVQIHYARRESRRGTAMSLYKGYLDHALANPKFSLASYPIDKPRYARLDPEADHFVAYEFYVSNLLFAVESILEVTRNDVIWRRTLRDQLKYHALYLSDEESVWVHYGDDVTTLVRESLHSYREEAKA